MAVVKNPLMSTDARGSTSGITYSFARGGNTARRKSKPSTHRADRIPTNRSILGFVSRRWSTITAAQRELWAAWVLEHPGTDRFGDPFIMSGINAFMMLNHKAIRLFGSGAYIEIPPAGDPVSAVNQLDAITGATNAGEIDLSWTELGTGIAADKWEVWIAGPFQSEGRVSVNNRYSYVTAVDGNVLLTTIDSLAEGFWYWFQVRYVASNGQKTAWVTDNATPKLTV